MEINLKPYPIQDKVWKYLIDKETNMILFGGSVRSSKSYLLCMWVTTMCVKYPGIVALVGRNRLTALKNTTVRSFEEFFEHQGIKEGIDYHFNRANMVITFHCNNSRIHFLELYNNPGDVDFTRLMSLNATICAVDECSEISYNAIEKLMSRLSFKLTEYNLIPKILLVSNPNRGFLYDKFYVPYRDGILEDYKKVVMSLVTDNLSISQSYIDSLKVRSTGFIKRYVENDWDYGDDTDSIINWESLQACYYLDTLDGDDTMYLSCDIASVGKDLSVFILWRGMEIIEIFTYKKLDIPQNVNKIKDLINLYRIKIGNVVIDATGIGQGVSDYLKGSYIFKGASKLNKKSSQNLRTECILKLAQVINEQKIKLLNKTDNPELKQRIETELMIVRFDDTDKNQIDIINKKKINQLLSHSSDYLDALMMKMVYLIKTKNKVFIY